ncbi:MAG TPA: sigma-54 dependent transcriptional regulator [candidate division Zixibacteria bacterium]|nr:sigma-54 dependent transcriptional regulator [candidate division Zixibacteria bacterium]
MAKVLVVDTDVSERKMVSDILVAEGHSVFQAGSADQAIQQVEEHAPDVVLTDLKMPEKEGLALVENLTNRLEPSEVIVLTAFGSIETAVKAMRRGAYDYLNKPVEKDELLLVVERAAEKKALRQESRQLKQELARKSAAGLVAQSESMRKILELVAKVAPSDATVLILGESGTGKEVVARMIHRQSPREKKLMQAINCAAFPETLLESELFGYEKGAFTGAQGKKIGIIEAASGSTLFLDEVADMSLGTQAKLLRVLQEREIRRLGGIASIPVDVRLIAATNKNLEEAMSAGAFRQDLFYRLSVIPIKIPPLRERREDIPALLRHFITQSGRPKILEPKALAALTEYDWPGNVRELQSMIERMAVLSGGDRIRVEDLPLDLTDRKKTPGATAWELPEEGINLEKWERNLLSQALEKSGGVMASAARLLGISSRTFQYRANKFGLKGR